MLGRVVSYWVTAGKFSETQGMHRQHAPGSLHVSLDVVYRIRRTPIRRLHDISVNDSDPVMSHARKWHTNMGSDI